MILVHILPTPPHYDAKVRVPGQAFLASNPHPSRDDWNKHRYWSRIHDALYSSMSGICSYCATFTPRRREAISVDHTSIDHFIPKSRMPSLAYEWSNYRLCRAKLNNRKSDFEDIIDPCTIQNGWFRLNFATFELFPDPALSNEKKQKVQDSIVRLELNQDDSLVQERVMAVYAYADGKLPFQRLTQYYPFIASEMKAQNFDIAHLPGFQRLLLNPKVRSSLGL